MNSKRSLGSRNEIYHKILLEEMKNVIVSTPHGKIINTRNIESANKLPGMVYSNNRTLK